MYPEPATVKKNWENATERVTALSWSEFAIFVVSIRYYAEKLREYGVRVLTDHHECAALPRPLITDNDRKRHVAHDDSWDRDYVTGWMMMVFRSRLGPAAQPVQTSSSRRFLDRDRHRLNVRSGRLDHHHPHSSGHHRIARTPLGMNTSGISFRSYAVFDISERFTGYQSELTTLRALCRLVYNARSY